MARSAVRAVGVMDVIICLTTGRQFLAGERLASRDGAGSSDGTRPTPGFPRRCKQAYCQLQCSDLLADHGRYGHLRFRADSDRMGFDSTFPLTRELRRVVDRHIQAHPGIGDAPMFGAPGDPSKPVTRYRVDRWLRVAERKAGLNPLPGKLWHAYRAKFATEMLDEPDRVVAALGGWKTPRTLDIYQQPDEGAMLRALERRRELRKLEG